MAFLRRTLSLAGCGVLAFLTSASAAQADQQQVFACIKQYTALVISADAALAQCQKDSMVGCVQRRLPDYQDLVAISCQALQISYKPGLNKWSGWSLPAQGSDDEKMVIDLCSHLVSGGRP